ncbi:flagellar biosynthesis anti-sigma factor FlgM [Brevibacillus sp. 7WMA2]|uniref:Negative regulator of flagellin synthesis n=1 Tax=Brevibacillus laterosporus LMG 15441 TaxID=1042163 RepID=A0A075R9T3_BRELA|nr:MULTISPECIES: flagellar biosynthesis anti-sigma factor FlgM [Brevibacillus]AIG28644.1 flagellar biosynthesis anti-sigma factor FlgM [Brevibacillus laterosporus LMG 15441]AUM66978.1 flagellar biosynthesis anti-sigma factor FlgM [Brevibacillus laterosporus]AYK05836.1 flagellar biosynthesis anti-sigma factor FlgM [Brevibacillus laterosporus]ERM17105.1 anti-sigma-28 factor, FlgM family protein [Brevibacillus laterosporus PE36]MBA4531867.1 flagellar biosynthesis anti-sigma factor FlgM [Brevibaci
MRINETNRTGMIQAYNKANKVQQNSQLKHKWGKDEVSISTEGMELLKLGEEQEMDSARLAKISELKSKVENGTYQVPSDQIAEKFIAFWKKS